jgi:hypothetical protein
MPGEDIHSWSTTASDNGDADTAINWLEGQARASVNDSARAMMAAHAKNIKLLNGSIETTGTPNAQVFTSGVGYTEYPNGLRALLQIGTATNTGATTLNMDGIGPKDVKDWGGGSLVGGELINGGFVELLYKGGDWRLLYQPVESVLLNVTTISDVSAVNYTGLIQGEFTKYVFVLTEITPKTDGANLYLRVSQDGGLTWLHGASDYAVVFEDFSSFGTGTGTYTSYGTSGTTAALVANDLSNVSTNHVSGEIELYAPHLPRYLQAKAFMTGWNAVAVHLYQSAVSGQIGPINGLQLLMSTGNIKSGHVLLYGVNG